MFSLIRLGAYIWGAPQRAALGRLIVCEARHSTLQDRGCKPCKGAAPAALHHRAGLWAARQHRPTEIFRYLQLAYFHVLSLLSSHGTYPATHPYFLALLILVSSADLLLKLPISSSAHCQAEGCSAISTVSQHGAIPPPHPTALLYMSPHKKKYLSFTPTSLPLQWKWQDDVAVSMGWPRAAQGSEKSRSSGAECCGAGRKGRLKGVSKRQEESKRKEGTLSVIRSLKRSVSSKFVPSLKHGRTVQMMQG